MALVLQTNSATSYYTDGKNFYTFYGVKDPVIALNDFACIKLGIQNRANFTPDQLSKILALTGTGSKNKTAFQLLKNGQVMPVPYKEEYPELRKGDILLALYKCPFCSSDTPPGAKCVSCGEPH